MCQSRPWTKHPPPLLVDHTQMSWSGPNFPLTFPMHFQRAWNSGTWQAFCFETTLVLAWTTISGGLKGQIDSTDGGYHNHAGTPGNLTFGELHMVHVLRSTQHRAWLFSSHIPSALRLSRKPEEDPREQQILLESAGQRICPDDPSLATRLCAWSSLVHQFPQMVSQPGIAWVLFVILGMAWWRDPSMQLVAPLSLPATTLWVVFEHAPEVITVPNLHAAVCDQCPTFKTSWIGPHQHASPSLARSLKPSLIDRCWTQRSQVTQVDSHVTSAFLLFVSAVWMTLIWVAVN